MFKAKLTKKSLFFICFVAYIVPLILHRGKLASTFSHAKFATPAVGLLFLSGFYAEDDSKYVHAWIYNNVIQHNAVIMSESRSYSDNFVSNFGGIQYIVVGN